MVFHMLRDIGGYAGTRIAYHHDIHTHRFQRIYRVENALALLPRRGVHVQVEDVGAEALAREVKAGTRSCARLEKQVGDGAATQRFSASDRGTIFRQVGFGLV